MKARAGVRVEKKKEVPVEYHKPALLQESIDGLSIKADGKYVDTTFGGGGHSREILKRLSDHGKLFAFDQDPDARANAIEDPRFQLIDQNFSFLKNFLKLYGMIPVDGILADLGVSFHQFDVAERGFSFRFDGPLDMRMDQKRKKTAAHILNVYAEQEIADLLRAYGELRQAKAIASKVAEKRKESEFKTIADLRELLEGFVPAKYQHTFMAQVFQALRIEVNQEMEVLETLLDQSKEVLTEGGRLVVITYHSLEDRMVKNYFRSGNIKGKQEKDLYGNLLRPFEPINRKPLTASPEELAENNRARSAKLRIAEKVAEDHE